MQQKDVSKTLTLGQIARQDWKWIVLGGVFAFFFANLLILGWKNAFSPDFHTPYAYGGDGKFIIWQIQRVMEGWIFDSARSGYPFGSNFLDYPNSDSGSLFILKILGLLTGSFYAALNWYLLLSFSLVFIVSYFVLRSFRFQPIYAFACAMLFAFAPFHLYRMYSHIYYSWYFVIPIYFYYAWNIFAQNDVLWPFNTLKKIIPNLLVLLILSSFGVYYTLFGIITCLVAGIAVAIKTNKVAGLLLSILFSATIAGGVVANLLPSIIHKHQYGQNQEAGKRFMVETEIYGLKISNMLFPHVEHRVKKLGNLVKAYIQNFGMNETISSSLGIVASFGFALLLLAMIALAVGRKVDNFIALLVILLLAFLLISTVGGLNVFFALLITPSIRGWNRISIFISFATLAAFFFMLQQSRVMTGLQKKHHLLYLLIPLAITGFGLMEQTSSAFRIVPGFAKIGFTAENGFVQQIEAIVPKEAAIYQLPYMRFPETPAVENLGDYELLGGFINSKTLRWSHGGIKGREGDLFYRHLSAESYERQLEVIKRLGFSGIYIDRRGFPDNGEEVIREFSQLLHSNPTLTRQDGRVVFFMLPGAQIVNFNGLNAQQIMEKVGYIVTKQGPVFYPGKKEIGTA